MSAIVVVSGVATAAVSAAVPRATTVQAKGSGVVVIQPPASAPPLVTSVYPSSGIASGGVAVAIAGARFTGAFLVTVGGVACSSVVVANDNTITCVTPPLSASSTPQDVAVTTPSGTATLAAAYVANWLPDFAGLSKTLSAPWYPGDGKRVEFFSGKYWLLGGWNPANNPEWGTDVTTNSVWSSPDLVTWTHELAHDPSPPTSGAGARWRRRHTFMTFVHDGLLWVVGGDDQDGSPVPSDVWNSPDGVTWTRVAASSSFGPAYLAIPGYFRGEMHVLGGESGVGTPTQHWKSTDGITWTALPNLPFSRASVTNAVVLDDKLFVIGGVDPTGPTEKNDTWMWDGTTWTQQSASAVWAAREWIATAAFDGKLWVLTGKVGAGNGGGLWHSDDHGVTWTAAAAYPYPASHADGIVTHADLMAVVAGNAGVGTGLSTAYVVKAFTDPSVKMPALAWRLWFDGANFSPDVPTISGKVSAGNSGSKTVEALNGPTMGTINGLPTIVLDGVDDFLRYQAGAGAADIVSNAAWTVVFTGKINSSPANANPYQNPALGNSSDADFAIDIRSTGVVEAYQFVGGVDKIATASWTAGQLVHIQARYDGTNISIRIGKGAWTNVASGASSITGSFIIGGNYLHANNAGLEVCEYAATNIAVSTADLDAVADDMRAKWGVTV